MKIVGIIPARYQSSRFPGKPLADILGKPMIWWVYNQVIKVSELDEVYVATDHKEIFETCKSLNINCIMTSDQHATSTSRVYEVAKKITADYYVCINGDEPLIDPELIKAIIPNKDTEANVDECYVVNLMTEIRDPVEVVDNTNIKVVVDHNDYAMLMSRSPVPYPRSNLNYTYKKHLGVLLYNLEALKFFNTTAMGKLETIEDINELRFMENGKKIKMKKITGAKTLSVDTPKDLERVIEIIKGS